MLCRWTNSHCWVSLSEPHLVRSMAGSSMYIGMSPYVHALHICCVRPLQFCMQWYAYCYTPGPYGLGQKWLPFTNVSNFPYGSLQMIIISNETIVAVQPCPPSMIFPAIGKMRNSTVVQLCTAISEHTSKGLAEARQ